MKSTRTIAIALATAALLAACGSSGKPAASSNTTGSTAGTSAASSTNQPAPASGSGTPSRKPCDLLTKSIAEDALGVPVGDAKDVPGQGNDTSAYSGADPSLGAKVFLTTYASAGSVAGLDEAATQFKNTVAVDGVGDAARVSLEDHAIGVLKGDFIFAMTLIPSITGSEIAPVTQAQMVKLANAVLAEL